MSIHLHKHYQQLWTHALSEFQQDRYVYDSRLYDPLDARRGITLLTRPPEAVKSQISEFLAAMRAVEPAQYCYPVSDLHLTLMSVISCYEGFALPQIQVHDYVEVVHQALKGISAFDISFLGITASPSCILLQGFPSDNQLQKLRDNLRHLFQESTLEQSIDQRYAIQTAHSTVLRFSEPLQQPAEFLRLLQAYREHHFGTFRVHTAELVFNDWYQRQAQVQTLASFSLDDK